MADAGYVRIFRSLLGHHAFRNDAEAMAFAWMIAKASWRTTRVRYKGYAITLERGQLAVSVRDFAEIMDRPRGWVERLFSRLKSETMIETQSKTGVNVVTICEYDKYQAEEDSGKTPRKTPRETAAGQRQDTEQRREEVKKVEEGANAPPSTRARKPKPAYEIPDWMPNEAWDGFIEMRIAKGKTPTPRAAQQIITKLDRFRTRGHDPTIILDASTINGWTDIYEPKETLNGGQRQDIRTGQQGSPDRRSSLARAIDEGLANLGD